MRELRLVAVVSVLVAAGAWWIMRPKAPAPARALVTASAVAPQARESESQPTVARVAVNDAPSSSRAAAIQSAGKVSFTSADGSGEPLELQINGGIGLWIPAEHRLRVVLTDEALNPAEEQQMLAYLRDERLADAGRPYGVLDLQFRRDVSTLDRGSLASASLTVASAGGVVHNTADVLSSLQWKGDMQPSAEPDGATRPRLELAAAGNAHAEGASSPQQNWQFSLAIPVAQAAAP